MSTREHFEAWASREGWAESDIDDKCAAGAPREGEYRHTELQDAWEVWQAALAAPAPQPEAGQVIKLGSYGKAFDLPGDRRAYTYKHQPNSAIAWQIGDASSRVEAGGDLIDRGLSLLKALEAHGFGVFDLAEDTKSQSPSVADRKPLTDEQATSLIDNATGWTHPTSGHYAIVRAVERAHGITAPEGKQP